MMKRAKPSCGSKGLSTPFKEVLALIRRGRHFLVTTHQNPDGDALGSALALGTALRRLRKKVTLYNEDRVPGNLQFLPHSNLVTQGLDPRARFDATFMVDCNERDRVGEAFCSHPGLGRLVVLDHHVLSRKPDSGEPGSGEPHSGKAGDINLIDRTAASSGVVVWSVLKGLRIPIDKVIAIQIYCTLVTDTGNFRYSNTDAPVMRLAAELITLGARPWLISKNVYESYPVERLRLMGEVLQTLEVSNDARYTSLTMTQEMLGRTGASADLSDEFINLARSVASVEVAAFFKEIDGGRYKVSFRSKDFVDVAALAAQFGGGGHQRASGCRLEGSLAEVKALVYQAIEAALSGSKGSKGSKGLYK